MKTEFAKAFEKRELNIGDKIVCVSASFWGEDIELGSVHTITKLTSEYGKYTVWTDTGFSLRCSVGDFEFKDVLEKTQSSQDAFKQECLASFLAEANGENKRLKEQLDGAIEINKQYEQQLFDMRMENARLELAALRWQMFDCEANRNIADKLLKKLADEQQDGAAYSNHSPF